MAYYAPFYQPTYYNQMSNRQDINPYNQQYQQPTQQMVPAQMSVANQPSVAQPNNSLIWVQGEAGAKSYLVAPGNTVMLMDSENSVFYLKSADASGMPMPLRIFDYKERTGISQQTIQAPVSEPNINLDNFVTREEFENRMASMASQCQCKNHAKNNLTEVSEDV